VLAFGFECVWHQLLAREACLALCSCAEPESFLPTGKAVQAILLLGCCARPWASTLFQCSIQMGAAAHTPRAAPTTWNESKHRLASDLGAACPCCAEDEATPQLAPPRACAGQRHKQPATIQAFCAKRPPDINSAVLVSAPTWVSWPPSPPLPPLWPCPPYHHFASLFPHPHLTDTRTHSSLIWRKGAPPASRAAAPQTHAPPPSLPLPPLPPPLCLNFVNAAGADGPNTRLIAPVDCLCCYCVQAPAEVLERIAGLLEGAHGSITLVERGDTHTVSARARGAADALVMDAG